MRCTLTLGDPCAALVKGPSHPTFPFPPLLPNQPVPHAHPLNPPLLHIARSSRARSPLFPLTVPLPPTRIPTPAALTAFEIAAMLYPITDMIGCLLFILFIVVLRDRVSVLSRKVDGANITTADYSVLVRGLPKDATVEDVIAHFNGLYNLEEPDWVYSGRMAQCWLGRKTTRRTRIMQSLPGKRAKVRAAAAAAAAAPLR